jgi:hypothetical protein
LCLCGTATDNEPFFPRVVWSMPQYRFAVLTAVAFKPSLHGEKPVNKDLSYRKAIFLSLPGGQCRLTLLMNFDVYVRETESERIHTS